MLKRLALVPPIAAALVPAANADPGREILTPSSPWNIDYAESECRLARTFGTGAEALTLRISRGANLKAVEYTVASKSLKIRDWNYNVLLRLGPGGTSYKLPILWYRLPTGETALQIFGETGLKPDEIASTRMLALEVDGAEPLQLAVGNLEQPFAALESCYDDLLTTWGIDPAGIRDLKKPAEPVDIRSWRVFENGWARDVPKDRKWMTVRLDIDGSGKATACKALVSSGSAELDTKVCALAAKNARLVPAVAASGEKVGAPFVLRIQMRE
ncbi:energy transducer TonB [Sphingopyxis sp. CCNWLW253]|uniref:energy transducer TonB family protein n=1 Tax=unclassified Sphingopyxis TaxID=2614943 RepID=UPI003013098B